MEPESNEKKPQRRKIIVLILFCALVVGGALAVFWYLQYASTHISTDDAFVDGHVHVIAPKISGTIRGIMVKDNQRVARGDLLVEIDPIDYRVRVEDAASAFQAESARIMELNDRVEVARKQFQELKYQAESARLNFDLQKTVLKQLEADIKKAEAGVEAQTAQLKQARIDIRRGEDLYKKEVISKEKYENTQTAYEVTEAQLKGAQEQLLQVQANRETQLARLKQAEVDVMKAEAALETQKTVIKQAESTISTQRSLIQQKRAVLKTSELNLDYTRIYAPADGYITKRSAEVGNQVQADQPLMSVVPLAPEEIWITANYKETQLKRVKSGQKVKIEVDMNPDRVFHGRVDSIMAGTGSAFSLFPPENATGNYVKVVQRIPVKIVLEQGEDPGHMLRIGMSVVPTILAE
jgi:membrane fusion protein (multidrug efflux system)